MSSSQNIDFSTLGPHYFCKGNTMAASASVIYRTIQWQVAYMFPNSKSGYSLPKWKKSRNHLQNSFFLYKQTPVVINYMRYSNLLDHNKAYSAHYWYQKKKANHKQNRNLELALVRCGESGSGLLLDQRAWNPQQTSAWSTKCASLPSSF